MATPTGSSKRYFNAALVQGSTWGTAAAVGAGNGLLVPNDGNPMPKLTYSATDAIGQVVPQDGDFGAEEPCEFEIPFDSKCGLQYAPGGIGSLIACLFGASAAPAQVGATAGYKHVFTWADEMSDFFTFACERSGAIREVTSLVPKKLTLKVGDGKVQGSIAVIGNRCINDSAVNTATQLDAVTPESTANFVKAQHGVLRMNTQSGGALAGSDAITVSDFTIEYERTIDAKMVLGGTYIAQPKEGTPKWSLKITLPYATAAAMAYETVFRAKAAQKMDIVFTGGVADATTYYTVTLGFPRIKFALAPDSPLEDIMKADLSFIVEEAAAAPTGMTAVHPWMEIVNLRTTNYLA